VCRNSSGAKAKAVLFWSGSVKEERCEVISICNR
jgi:hypothetical protein